MGVRECFVPRPCCAFIDSDFPSLELYCFAQVAVSLFGFSDLRDMLQGGIDPHTRFAADLLDISYEEANRLKDAHDKTFSTYRQIAKVNNFGRLGGMGAKKLVALAAGPAYRVTLTESDVKAQGRVWYKTFSEAKPYFKWVSDLLGGQEFCSVPHPVTGFVRGGARYCAAANFTFQHLGAICAKNAMIRVAEKQYVDTTSPLFGTRSVLFVHDQIICEAPYDTVHITAPLLGRTMARAANEYLPDCPISEDKMAEEAVACEYWSKDARPLHDAAGRLVPWSHALDGLLGMATALNKRTISSHS